MNFQLIPTRQYNTQFDFLDLHGTTPLFYEILYDPYQ